MATIDDKVVAMSFESSKFESGVNSAIKALDKLKASLNFPSAGKGLDDINAAAKRMDLSHIASAVDSIKGKFSALSITAIAALANIVTKAVDAGLSVVKAFTLDPIAAGFKNYETQINAVQTIVANTGLSGKKGLDQINASLADMNTYANKTVYNFSEMVRNIGTFTAAGVDLKTSAASIKGIANLAALSGSNSGQAASAMYQLSQAIAANQVKLQDWNSVVNAGIGGKVFQEALFNTGQALHTIKTADVGESFKQWTDAGNTFRTSLKSGWLTGKVLTQTLQGFTGDLTDAQLKSMGYTEAQAKEIKKMGAIAVGAAVNIKTFTQLTEALKEEVATAYAAIFKTIFGNLADATKLFSAIHITAENALTGPIYALNNILQAWAKLGGRVLFIDALKTGFEDLRAVADTLKASFRDIFPAETGKGLYDLTVKFHDFMDELKPSPETLALLKRTFDGLFAVLDIGKQIIGGIFTMFGKLFSAVSSGQGGFLSFTATIGDFLVKLDDTLKKGDVFNRIFSTIGDVLTVPIKLLGELSHALTNLFSGFSSGGFSKQISNMSGALTPFQKIMVAVEAAWKKFMDSFTNSGNLLQSAVDTITQVFIALGPAISNAISSINWNGILAVVRTGLLGGLFLVVKNFLGDGSLVEQFSGLGAGIFKNISGSFSALEGSMVAMQNNIKAKTLKEIAIAIALLAASVVALSFVNPTRLNASLVAIGVMMGELVGTMALLDKIAMGSGFLKLPVIAAGLVVLAGAIDLLVIAVFAMSKLSWEELLKGLGGVGALLVGLSAAAVPLSANSAGMIRAGIGITAIAVALKILASAMKDFGGMSWTELGKGLAGVGGGLAIMAAATSAMPSSMVLIGAGLIAVAVGLKLLAGAVETFGGMDWKVIGKGLVGIGGALVIIAGAMQLMPLSLPVTAAGLILVSVALGKIADAVESMGNLSISEIAKGLGTLAGSLVILAAALYAMSGTLAGSAALVAAAAGIALLAPALESLGKQSWTEILKSLVTLAAALTVLGIAGVALSPTIPALLGLGAALVLIGGGLALAGAGIFLISAGISALAVAGPAGVHVLIDALNQLLEAIPELAKNFILGILTIVDQLAKTAPKFVDAVITIIQALLKGIIEAAPKMADAFTALINAALQVLHDNQAKLIQAGWDLLTALLKGLSNNIGQLVSAVSDIIVKFLNSIANNISKIVTAGSDMLTALLKGIADHISNVVSSVASIIAKFLDAVGDAYVKIVAAGLSILTKLLSGIGDNLDKILKTSADVIAKFISGLGALAGEVVAQGVSTMISFIQGLSQNGVKLANAAGQAILDFLNGIKVAINKYEPQITAAAIEVGVALVTGLGVGVEQEAEKLYGKISGVMNHAMSLIHKIPIIGSPSKVTTDVGMYIIQGLIKGMESNEQDLYSTVTTISNELIAKFKDTFQIKSPSKVMHDIGQAVGQGFADGLKGSQDDIRSAFTTLNNQLTDAMVTARDTIKSEQDKLDAARKDTIEKQAALDKLRADKKPDEDSIKNALDDLKTSQATVKEIQGVLAENEDILKRTTDGHNALVSTLKNEKQELIGLSGEYQGITDKLKDAQQKLADLKKAQQDLISSTTSQYDALPSLDTTSPQDIANAKQSVLDAKAKLHDAMTADNQDTQAITDAQTAVAAAQDSLKTLLAGKTLDSAGNSVDQLATYEDALKHQTTAIGAYNSTLQQLRKMGMDDATYQKLVTDGTADQAFATELVKGGHKAVDKLNTLDGNLQNVATSLGKHVGSKLKDSGIAAAQGIVDGLDKKKGDVYDKIKEIADEMVATLNRNLKIKSPSQVFAEIGRFSMEGMAQGLTDNTHLVANAADQVAQDALTAMQLSMSNISGAIFDELDTTPVITPVLDLSVIRSQAKDLSTIIPITAATSYGQASIISASTNIAQTDPNVPAATVPSVKFEQNNYSPEALTEIEIYRQTKNQLSQLKTVLALT